MSPRRSQPRTPGASSRPKRRSSSAARRGGARPKPRVDETSTGVPAALRRLGLEPRKALGQHFLLDEFVLADIAKACGLDASSTVLEVGAGPGALTEELAKRAGTVVAVELDEELAALTRQRLSQHQGVCVVAADALDFTPAELLEECEAEPPYVATGNLPYYITQPLVRRFIEAEPPPERIVVMVQREVGRRMVGGPGRGSFLSMSIALFGRAETLFDVPPTAFWPPPQVHSTVVRIERSREAPFELPRDSRPRFLNLLHAGFSEPRKQLHNALRASLGVGEIEGLLEAARIEGEQRAQHLELADWARLFEAVEQRHPGALDAIE